MIIDWELSLKLAGNNQQTAEDLLALLIKTLPNELSDIKSAFENNQHYLLKRLLHKLHGALCYCELPNLKQAVKAFESALKNNEATLFPLLYFQLTQAVHDLINFVNNKINLLQSGISTE